MTKQITPGRYRGLKVSSLANQDVFGIVAFDQRGSYRRMMPEGTPYSRSLEVLAQIQAGEKALEEEIRKVRELVRGPDGKSPFPSCAEMDSKTDFQAPRPTHDTVNDLSKFAEYVRHRMAFDPHTGKILYYSQKDVRSLIGGLGNLGH